MIKIDYKPSEDLDKFSIIKEMSMTIDERDSTSTDLFIEFAGFLSAMGYHVDRIHLENLLSGNDPED